MIFNREHYASRGCSDCWSKRVMLLDHGRLASLVRIAFLQLQTRDNRPHFCRHISAWSLPRTYDSVGESNLTRRAPWQIYRYLLRYLTLTKFRCYTRVRILICGISLNLAFICEYFAIRRRVNISVSDVYAKKSCRRFVRRILKNR